MKKTPAQTTTLTTLDSDQLGAVGGGYSFAMRFVRRPTRNVQGARRHAVGGLSPNRPGDSGGPDIKLTP